MTLEEMLEELYKALPPQASPGQVARFNPSPYSVGNYAPQPDATVHTQPAAPGPAWYDPGTTGYQPYPTAGYDIQEPGAEAMPFGSLADPVSQLSFLAAPAMQQALKTLIARAQAGMEGPIPLGKFLSGERGNLGPPPVDAQGRPLPESVLRDAEGNVQKFYHGTIYPFEDFDVHQAARSAATGRGVYMASEPIATEKFSLGNSDYATYLQGEAAKEVERAQIKLPQVQADLARIRGGAVSPAQEEYRQYLQQQEVSLQEVLADASAKVFAPQTRPVYADVRSPFVMYERYPREAIEAIIEKGNVPDEVRERFVKLAPWKQQTGWHWYEALKHAAKGDADLVNAALRQAGYDGTLTAHAANRIWGTPAYQEVNAFSPDQVYPAPAVETLLQKLREAAPAP